MSKRSELVLLKKEDIDKFFNKRPINKEEWKKTLKSSRENEKKNNEIVYFRRI